MRLPSGSVHTSVALVVYLVKLPFMDVRVNGIRPNPGSDCFCSLSYLNVSPDALLRPRYACCFSYVRRMDIWARGIAREISHFQSYCDRRRGCQTDVLRRLGYLRCCRRLPIHPFTGPPYYLHTTMFPLWNSGNRTVDRPRLQVSPTPSYPVSPQTPSQLTPYVQAFSCLATYEG